MATLTQLTTSSRNIYPTQQITRGLRSIEKVSFDCNPSRSRRCSLGNIHTQNPMLQTRLDPILISPNRKAECPTKVADRSLCAPIPAFRQGPFTLFGSIFALGGPLHYKRMRVCKLQVDIFLFDTRELAIEEVGIVSLADVEAWMEGTGS